jgi:hypothetical protein
MEAHLTTTGEMSRKPLFLEMEILILVTRAIWTTRDGFTFKGIRADLYGFRIYLRGQCTGIP